MPKQANPAKVVIVGAGAMGMTLDYHLSLAGAKITFLIRPVRASRLSRPQVLYSYDDNSLKTFSEFEVITAPDAVSVRASDYVVVTLDGSATRSPEGTALIGALARTVADTEAVMIGGGVGVGLRDHYLAVTGLPSRRVMMGVLGSLAYQVDRVRLPLHPPTDPSLLARASVAYRHYSKNGLIVEGRFADPAKQFAALYDRNSVVRCSVLEPHLYDLSTMVPFPIYAGSELPGWRPTSEMAKDKAVWRLTADAVREIARLGRNGWRGQLESFSLR